jgi:hypothetical protein
MSLNPITHPLLDKAGVRHGFFTREGGVSEGIYAGLNTGVGSNDDPAAVAENRRRVAEWMGGAADDLCGCYQIHSAVTRVADSGWKGERPEGDAVVTAVRGPIASILTADCAPVLFADAEAGVVGAAHAGWKGALGGIVHSTVAAMEALGANPERMVLASRRPPTRSAPTIRNASPITTPAASASSPRAPPRTNACSICPALSCGGWSRPGSATPHGPATTHARTRRGSTRTGGRFWRESRISGG